MLEVSIPHMPLHPAGHMLLSQALLVRNTVTSETLLGCSIGQLQLAWHWTAQQWHTQQKTHQLPTLLASLLEYSSSPTKLLRLPSNMLPRELLLHVSSLPSQQAQRHSLLLLRFC